MPKASDLLKVAPKYLSTPYSKMDCQAFVERCLKDIGIDDNLPGSNAWYRRMTWVGTPEECKRSFGKIPSGAFLFILKQDGKEPEKYRPHGDWQTALPYPGCVEPDDPAKKTGNRYGVSDAGGTETC